MTITTAMSCLADVDQGRITDASSACPVSSDPVPTSIEQLGFDKTKLVPIPSPPHHRYFGLLGHAPDLDSTLPVRSYWQLMDIYAPIYQLDLGMTFPRVFVGSRALVNEMADDDRFIKFTHRLHQEMRPVFGDGLFSAESTSKAWGKAHRLLVPALGPVGLSRMFDDMLEISAQLTLKWDRFGPEQGIECIEDMSRLTFDTIGLCAFGYRFNEFYSEECHPFMTQLKESIVESGRRANRPDLMNQFYYREEKHRQENIIKMRELCKKIIQERIDNPNPDAKDLLNVMINGIDRETGEKLGIQNVMHQIPTLLGGGFETTGSTLCFIWYFLCSNPGIFQKAQQEVDDIVGDRILTYDMLRNLKYLDACMKEALRMQHPVSLLTRFATKDTVLGGKYFINKGQMVSGIWRHFHRDPIVWGDDADKFRPERMLDVNFQKLPPNSWKPFGDGLRACIGRGFAEQEILIHMAMVLQKFEMEKVDPEYDLQLKGQMGVKPIDFKIRVKRRPHRSLMIGIPGGGHCQQHDRADKERLERSDTKGKNKEPAKLVTVLYGSNMGTSESLVQSLSKVAPEFRLDLDDVRELDEAVGDIPTNRPCIIICPSYEGRPPDNAKKFIAWIEKLASSGEKLPAGVKFAVFGVGNSDWVHTFHRIPRLIDEKLELLGAERVVQAGFANVKRDLVGPWEAWSEKVCTTLSDSQVPQPTGTTIVILTDDLGEAPSAYANEQMMNGIVIVNRELADTSIGTAKRHIGICLPHGSQYKSGDYLAVQGRNSDEIVCRILNRFGLNREDVMRVTFTKKDFLPTKPMAIEHFLRSKAELAAPVTKRQLSTLASWAKIDSPEHSLLEKMHEDVHYQQLLNERYSVIDVLEEVPALNLPFEVYVDFLLPLQPRSYSISSSPFEPENNSVDGPIVSLTFDVFEAASSSGHGTFHGVASSYLASRKLGDHVSCAVRETKLSFRLPVAVEKPIIMVATGSGIAPMRAFIEERAALSRSDGCKFGPALLFFGCRHPEKDFLYRTELERWERQGVVRVIPCFSKPADGSVGRHVSDGLWEHQKWVWEMFCKGAHIYTCGSATRLGRSAGATWRRIWRENTGKTEAEAHEWLDHIKNDRYISDVY